MYEARDQEIYVTIVRGEVQNLRFLSSLIRVYAESSYYTKIDALTGP